MNAVYPLCQNTRVELFWHEPIPHPAISLAAADDAFIQSDIPDLDITLRPDEEDSATGTETGND